PCITWMQPRRTSSFGDSACTSAPSNTIEPLVTSPRSEWSRLEIALSVVVLPEPLAPRSATMPPFCTDNDTPLSTKMTRSYTTSILLSARMASAAGSEALLIGKAVGIGCAPQRHSGAERSEEPGIHIH